MCRFRLHWNPSTLRPRSQHTSADVYLVSGRPAVTAVDEEKTYSCRAAAYCSAGTRGSHCTSEPAGTNSSQVRLQGDHKSPRLLSYVNCRCDHHLHSEGGIGLVVSVCLCACLPVCLSVNMITPEPLEISPQSFHGIIPWSKGQTSLKVAIVRCAVVRKRPWYTSSLLKSMDRAGMNLSKVGQRKCKTGKTRDQSAGLENPGFGKWHFQVLPIQHPVQGCSQSLRFHILWFSSQKIWLLFKERKKVKVRFSWRLAWMFRICAKWYY